MSVDSQDWLHTSAQALCVNDAPALIGNLEYSSHKCLKIVFVSFTFNV